MNRSASASPTPNNSSTQTPRSSTPNSQPNQITGNLSDAQLDIPIPIFGSNEVQLLIRDLVNVFPTPSTLNRVRAELREFLISKMSLSSAPNEENVKMVSFFLILLSTFYIHVYISLI